MGEVGILRGAGALSSDAQAFSPDNHPTFSSSSIRPLPSTPRVAEGSTKTTPEQSVNAWGAVVIGTTPPGTRRLYNCFEPEVEQGGAVASPGGGGAADTAGGMRGWLHKRRDHLPGTLRRWFTLEGGQLSYFLSDRDPAPRKVYDVRGLFYTRFLCLSRSGLTDLVSPYSFPPAVDGLSSHTQHVHLRIVTVTIHSQ